MAASEQVDDFIEAALPLIDSAKRLGLNAVIIVHSADQVEKVDCIDYTSTGSWPVTMGLVEWLRNELTRNS